jgi:tRNA pseudouridine55 synthase
VSGVSRIAERGPNGILVLRKPPGPSSHDMVALVRRLTGVKRVGHGGTLDPFASGVLPVFLGLATRLVEYHMGDDKAYRATVCLGTSSSTDDRDGELTPGPGPAPDRERVATALEGFRGQIEQRPPAFSALKIGGRRAYELARRGETPQIAPRTVIVKRLELVGWDASDPERPLAVLEVECGAGTYVRSLARDLGQRLGCGAYLGALERTRSGPFGLDGAHDPDEVRAAAARGPERLAELMLPVDAGLESIPAATLEEREVVAAARGQAVRPARGPDGRQGTVLRLVDGSGTLVGMGSWRAGRVVPEKMFVAPSPGSADRKPARPPVTLAGIDELTPELGPLYLAVGVFDGLHLGHLHLLRELRRGAEKAGAQAAVITFDAHPEEVVAGLAPPLLCDPDERLARLAGAGVGVTVVQHFDHALRMTSYRDFIGRIRDRVVLAGLAMTPDAAFGYERRGTPEALAELGREVGFAVTMVDSLLLDGEQVRSSEIRRRIGAGDLDGAARMLGRAPAVTGRIGRHEDGRAVLTFELPVVLPPAGTYAAEAGPAWTLVSRPSRGGRRTVAQVTAAGEVSIDGGGESGGAGEPAGDAVRLAFVGLEAAGAEAGPTLREAPDPSDAVARRREA